MGALKKVNELEAEGDDPIDVNSSTHLDSDNDEE